MPWIDIHNHLQDKRLKPLLNPILNEAKNAKIIYMGVNGTHREDWPEVIQLSEEYPEVLPFLGIHPWAIEKAQENDLSQLEHYLQQHPNMGIGEIGLDKQKYLPDIDTQASLFIKQLELAKTYHRSTSIHCINAWGPLLKIFKSIELPQAGILLHAFNGSFETAQELLQWKQTFFSISPALNDPSHKKLRRLIPQLPMDRILLESDAPHHKDPSLKHGNTPLSIMDTAQALAAIHNTTLKEIEELTFQNARRFLNQH